MGNAALTSGYVSSKAINKELTGREEDLAIKGISLIGWDEFVENENGTCYLRNKTPTEGRERGKWSMISTDKGYFVTDDPENSLVQRARSIPTPFPTVTYPRVDLKERVTALLEAKTWIRLYKVFDTSQVRPVTMHVVDLNNEVAKQEYADMTEETKKSIFRSIAISNQTPIRYGSGFVFATTNENGEPDDAVLSQLVDMSLDMYQKQHEYVKEEFILNMNLAAAHCEDGRFTVGYNLWFSPV